MSSITSSERMSPKITCANRFTANPCCSCWTPLGLPVVPPVYAIKAISRGSGAGPISNVPMWLAASVQFVQSQCAGSSSATLMRTFKCPVPPDAIGSDACDIIAEALECFKQYSSSDGAINSLSGTLTALSLRMAKSAITYSALFRRCRAIRSPRLIPFACR